MTSNWKNVPRWDADEIKEIRTLAGRGWSVRDIAKKMNRTTSSVSGVARRNGIHFMGKFTSGRTPEPTRTDPDARLKRF